MKRFMTALTLLSLVTSTVNATAATGIVGNWHLDTEKGQTAQDSSPYGKHGRLGSTTGIDVDDPSWTMRRFDTSALNFNNSYVFIKNYKQLEAARITLEAWVKPVPNTETHELSYIVAKGLSPSNDFCGFASYALYLVDEQPVFYISDGDFYYSSPFGSPILDGQWHHLVGTYDRKNIRLYMDGVEVGTGTPSTVAINYSRFPVKDLIIGDIDGTNGPCINVGGFFTGDIDEVRIWNRALTASEVATRYQGD